MNVWLFSGEGPACTFWVFLRKYSIQLDDSSLRVAWTTGSQTPVEHHSRWPDYTLCYCHCPWLMTLPHSHLLTFFLLILLSSLTLKKSPLSFWSLAYYNSILIKNSMKSAWAWLFLDLLLTPSRTKSFFEIALVMKQRHSGQLEMQHDSHLSPRSCDWQFLHISTIGVFSSVHIPTQRCDSGR